jgi:hypothetical protein
MEADGGMPGATTDGRVGATIAALFAFLSQGHTAHIGPFRSHVAKLRSFLASIPVSGDRQILLKVALDIAHEGRAPAGDWLTYASGRADPWIEIARVFQEQSAGTGR